MDMSRMRYSIWLSMVVVLVYGCRSFSDVEPEVGDEQESVVEVLDDGRLRVSADLVGSDMLSVETATRTTSSTDPEDVILDGWCFVFGEDKTLYPEGSPDGEGYGPDSPLLQISKIVANANGRFFMTFEQTTDKAFMRIVANLPDRENTTMDGVVTSVEAGEVRTFGEYIYQSVGLDGLYDMSSVGGYGDANGNPVVVTSAENDDGTYAMTYSPENENSPDPSKGTVSMPMSSYGFVLDDGITAESLASIFNNEVDMIRTYSKVDVEVDAGCDFEIYGVTLLGGANEARMRSTVLETSGDGTSVSDTFDVPEDLGGAVDFMELVTTDPTKSDPIYFYPNTGGGYEYTNGVVDQDVNPTYIIVRGKAGGYDEEDGFYKIALKAQYPIAYDAAGEATDWSDMTYDILRDTHFKVLLKLVDKPGYKTFADAASPNNPANNISYSIIINGSDNRNEFLVSKGTYFMELEGSRVYAKGYLGEAVSGDISFSLNPTEGNYHPKIYIYGDDEDIDITSIGNCADAVESTEDGWWEIPAYKGDREDVTVNFTAKGSGRIRIRCGDILKFVPVVYDNVQVSYLGTGDALLTVNNTQDTSESWSDFRYDDIVVESGVTADLLTSDGKISTNAGNYSSRELRAQIYPTDGSGVTKLYVKQASDFAVVSGSANKEISTSHALEYVSTGKIISDTSDVTLSGYTTSYGMAGESTSLAINNSVTNSTDHFSVTLNDNASCLFSAGVLHTSGSYCVVTSALDANGDGKPDFMDAFERTTTLRITNGAGDYKDYNIVQTQHQPIYFSSTAYSTEAGNSTAYYTMSSHSGYVDSYMDNNSGYKAALSIYAESSLSYTNIKNNCTLELTDVTSSYFDDKVYTPVLATPSSSGDYSFGKNNDPSILAMAWVLCQIQCYNWSSRTGTAKYQMIFKDPYDTSITYVGKFSIHMTNY